jgi:hypothetical protein
MKKSFFAVLFAASLLVLGAQAQADDSRDENNDRYQRYGYREGTRYEHPRYCPDEVVIVRRPRRVIVQEEEDCRPRYYRRSHHGSSFRLSFGGF